MSLWSSEVLFHVALLAAPPAACHASSLLRRLYNHVERQLIDSYTLAQLAPWQPQRLPATKFDKDALEAGPAEDADPLLLQYSNATFSQQSRQESFSAYSTGNVDSDADDLDFCLMTPQQAVGTLGAHAPNFTKIFLNGLPLMADSNEGTTLSLDECALRMRAASSSIDGSAPRNGGRTRARLSCSHASSLPSTPCLTPSDCLELADEVCTPPAHSAHHNHSMQHASVLAPASQRSGSGVCSASTSFRSLASSVRTAQGCAYGEHIAVSQRSSFDDQEAAHGYSTQTTNRGEEQHKGQQQQDDTEGPHPLAAPQVSCPLPQGLAPLRLDDADGHFAVLAIAPNSCTGGLGSSDGDGISAVSSPFASAAWLAGERRRSISECGDSALLPHHDSSSPGSFSGDLRELASPLSVRSPATSSPTRPKQHTATAGSAHPTASAGAAAPPRTSPRQEQQPKQRRWLPSGHCAPAPRSSAGAGPTSLPHRAATTAAGGNTSRRLNLGASVDNALLAVHLRAAPARLMHSRSSPAAVGAAALPPLPPKIAPARHGSGPVPPRPPHASRPACSAAAVAAAAAATAPAGLCKAPALPLPPDAFSAAMDSSVPPALRYYLAQARAAGVQVATSATGADGAVCVVAAQQGRPAGYVRAVCEQYAQRQAKVVTCHITPYANSHPTPIRKARSPPPLPQGVQAN